MADITLDQLEAELRNAKARLQTARTVEERIYWRNEVGRLTDAIRRAQMVRT